jgi:hypothetical protein
MKDPVIIGGVCVKAVGIDSVKVVGIGSVSWMVTDKTSYEHTVRLSDVLYAPQLLEHTNHQL